MARRWACGGRLTASRVKPSSIAPEASLKAAGRRGCLSGGIDPNPPPEDDRGAPQARREAIRLPSDEGSGGLHSGQAEALRTILAHKRVALRAGRRFGKSLLLVALAADEALRGRPVGYFTPYYKTSIPVFDTLAFMLDPLVTSRNRVGGELRLSTGGVIDIWTFEASTIIARGRKYAVALLDEVAFTKADVGLLWRASIA
jgi:hypothetical protein